MFHLQEYHGLDHLFELFHQHALMKMTSVQNHKQALMKKAFTVNGVKIRSELRERMHCHHRK